MHRRSFILWLSLVTLNIWLGFASIILGIIYLHDLTYLAQNLLSGGFSNIVNILISVAYMYTCPQSLRSYIIWIYFISLAFLCTGTILYVLDVVHSLIGVGIGYLLVNMQMDLFLRYGLHQDDKDNILILNTV